MEDHHVDRPEVEAEQSAQPTGTNRSNPPDPNAVPGISRGQPENRRRAAASAHQAPIKAGIPDRGSPAAARQTLPPSPSQFPPGRQSTDDRRQSTENHLGILSSGDAAFCGFDLLQIVSSVHRLLSSAQGGLASLVATARGQTPDPIPNSAVKTLSADGTAAQAAEEQVAARLAKPPNTPPNTPLPRGGAAR